MVGAENDGWSVTKSLLSSERTNIARIGMTKHILRRVKAMTSDDPSLGVKAAAIEAELKMLEVTQLRVLDAQRHSDGADPRSSVLKLKGVELRQAASELLVAACGIDTLRAEAAGPEAIADPLGTALPNYAILRAASIYGGASEVQKTIVAKNILGL
nr:acyl-CoA dehydrogenase family protein [Sphingomonas tagetis]